MKNFFMLLLFAVNVIAFPYTCFCKGATTKTEWIGQWNMNHDGFEGKLTISETRADCANTAWCDMAISYINSRGERINGSIQKIDDNWQHMVFFLNFPGNRQKFDAYLFSWDKQKLAGTTYWNNRTFGFFASKTPGKARAIVNLNDRTTTNAATTNTQTAPPDEVIVSKKILSGDTIETKYLSGRIRWKTRGGYTDKFPDGRELSASFAQTPEFTPPNAVSDQNVIRWLNSIQNTLLEMIKEELLNDQVSINGILNKERTNQFNTYQIINNRFYFLNYLNNLK